MTPDRGVGFPHSDIPGSQPAHGSPRLIAVFHVLHRHLAPRHPPYALSSLTQRDAEKLTFFHLLISRILFVSYSVVKVLSFTGIFPSSGSLAAQAVSPALLVSPPRGSNCFTRRDPAHRRATQTSHACARAFLFFSQLQSLCQTR